MVALGSHDGLSQQTHDHENMDWTLDFNIRFDGRICYLLGGSCADQKKNLF
jgi:hypothetical protein